MDGENCDFSESGGSGTLRMKLKKKKDKEEGSGKGSSKELKGRVYIEDNNQVHFVILWEYYVYSCYYANMQLKV